MRSRSLLSLLFALATVSVVGTVAAAAAPDTPPELMQLIGMGALATLPLFGVRRGPAFDSPSDQGGGTATLPAGVDQATMDAAVERAIERRTQERLSQTPPAGGAPPLNPNPGQEGGASSISIGDEGRIITNPRERAQLGRLLHRYFKGQATRSETLVTSAVDEMVREGFYGPSAQQEMVQHQRTGLSTLTDADGAVFLPEVVLNEVLRIAPEYGVIRRLARIISIGSGTVRIPNLTSGLSGFWIGEGATIKARKAVFGKSTLDPEKMGLIVPWTNELSEEAGESFMDLIVQLIAEAFGLLEDQTGFYGDGTSAYGGITGLKNAASVNVWNLGGGTTSGKTNFNQITRADLIGAMKMVHPSVRRMGTWVFHPDTELTLSSLADSNGRPIYEDDYRTGGVPTLLGRPVEYAQAMLAESATAVSTVLGFYGDFSKFLLAQGRGMTSMLLDQATITDVDDSTLIHLGAQDMKALRVTQRLDMLVALPTAFVRLRTAAS